MLGEADCVVLLFQKQRSGAGLYEVAGAELVHQDVIQVIAIALVDNLHALLQQCTSLDRKGEHTYRMQSSGRVCRKACPCAAVKSTDLSTVPTDDWLLLGSSESNKK